MKAKNNPRSGFTLIETLLALAILATAAVVMLTIREHAIHQAEVARNDKQAALLAERLLGLASSGALKEQRTREPFDDHPGYSYTVQFRDYTFSVEKAKLVHIEIFRPGDFESSASPMVFETIVPEENS